MAHRGVLPLSTAGRPDGAAPSVCATLHTDVLAFEYGSRIAVENNTILMLLRFLNQDMAQYTTTITEIAPYR